MASYFEKQRELPISYETEVVVAGGGCAGTMAAIAAARNGARTLLIEKYAFLGGASTAQYVPLLPTWNLAPWDKETKPLIGGLAQEICTHLEELGGTILPEVAYRAQKNGQFPSIWFHHDFELMKIVKQDMCNEAEVGLLLHSYVVDTIVEEGIVKGIIVENKSGRQAILANVVIDSTGDGDVAARAGADFKITRGSNIIDGVERGVMPITLDVKFANVDMKKLGEATKRNPSLIREAMTAKAPELIDDVVIFPPYGDKPSLYAGHGPKLPEPYLSNPKYYPVTRPGVITHGIHSYGHDITRAEDLTAAELSVRKKAKQLLLFLKENIPGYESAYISTTPTQIGLRESRRIIGEYILTEEDMLVGSNFDDVILRNRIGEWDIGENGQLRDYAELLPTFDIPYRCIIPREIDGVMVAGRCISITHEAAYYFTPRDIATAWGLGEAAGTSAALCAKMNATPRELEVGLLQEKLTSQGFNL
jgi:hypothetical protein